MNHFRIHDVEVDVARCSILKAGVTGNVEPKSMAVLQYLATHHHQVISQEVLFNSIWPKSTFSSGTVQRCIAQLRKALGDNSKSPIYIKTHPKRGYSLDIEPVKVVANKHVKWSRFCAVFLLIVALVFMGRYFLMQGEAAFEGQLTPITASSHYDFYPTYSPDGSTLAFIRQEGEHSHIYLIDSRTKHARRLSERSQNYQALTWENDGKGIFYVVRDRAGDRVEYLATTTANKAGAGPASLFSLKEEGNIWKVAHRQQSLIYMHAFVPLNQAPQTQLKVFDLQASTEEILLKNTRAFTPYRISLAPDKQRLAIAGENAVNQIEVRLFDFAQQTLGEPIKSLPLGFTEISWHPNGKELLLHHMNSLYLLSLGGQLQPLPYRHYQNLYNPKFHPDASHIVLTMTEQDQDIYHYDVENSEMQKVIDSSGEDNLARLSSDGEAIAFVSSRAGYQQVYIQDKGNERLVFPNDGKALIYRAPVWSVDGKSIAFSAGSSVYFFNTELQIITEHTLDKTLTSVLDWYSDSESLLIVIKQQSVSEFAKYNISRKEIQPLTTSGVNPFARVNSQDQLIFVKDRKVQALNQGQSSPAIIGELPDSTVVFPVQDGVICQQGQSVWRLDNGGQRALITSVPDTITRLIDVSSDGKLWLFSSNNQQTAKIVSLQ